MSIETDLSNSILEAKKQNLIIMSVTPLISILMPVYNSEKYIADCITSILSQTCKDFEFIIVNDASTDRTPQIVGSFKDGRIKLINNKKRCFPPTRNKALRVAKGKYICIMDADDISLPYRLERQVEFMEAHTEFGLAGSGYRIIGKDQDLFRDADYNKIMVHLLRNNNFIHPTIIMRHDLVKKSNLAYSDKFYYSSDYDFIIKAARCFPITNIQETLLLYRVHKDQITSQHRLKQAEFAEEISIDQLKYLGIEPMKDERRTHLELLNGFPLPFSKKKEVKTWIDKILAANRKSRYFKEAELESFLDSLLSRQSFFDWHKRGIIMSIISNHNTKIDLRDVTFVFPVRIESQHRIRNLKAILEYLTNSFNTNISILESDKERHLTEKEIEKTINYKYIMDSDEIFQRTNLRNKMISETSTPFVAVFDSDSIAAIEQITDSVNTLRTGEAIMGIPFDGRYLLCNDIISSLFINKMDIEVLNRQQENLKLMFGHHCVGGAYIVNKNEFLKAAGENENIRGWGCEDTERVKNLEIKDLKVHYSAGPLYHLWHPKGKNSYFANQSIKGNNIKELLKTCSWDSTLKV